MYESHCEGRKEWISPVDRAGKTWKGNEAGNRRDQVGVGEEYWEKTWILGHLWKKLES